MKRKLLTISRLLFLVACLFISFSFKSRIENGTASDGVFTCIIDDKPFQLKGVKAYMRTVTGGYRQLSLSNDRFSKFFLIKPEAKSIPLGNPATKEAVIYYTDPVNLNVYKPFTGYLNIKTLDEDGKVITGEFEMEMECKTNQNKKIKIKQGKLVNIPIIYL